MTSSQVRVLGGGARAFLCMRVDARDACNLSTSGDKPGCKCKGAQGMQADTRVIQRLAQQRRARSLC